MIFIKYIIFTYEKFKHIYTIRKILSCYILTCRQVCANIYVVKDAANFFIAVNLAIKKLGGIFIASQLKSFLNGSRGLLY